MKRKVLLAASVASMVLQFNLPNIKILLAMGYKVHVACNFKEGNTCGKRQVQELLQILNSLHVQCHQWDCPRKLRSVRSSVRAYLQMDRLLRQHQFAWVHCQSPIGGALARLAGHRLRVPMLYTAHGFHFYKGAPLFHWLLYYPAEKLLARWTDVLVTVNQEDFRFARRRLRAGKVCYIPGVGVDTERFLAKTPQNIRKRYHIPKDASILLSVGELSRRKNHAAVIRALADMQETNVYYLICGQGAQKSRLQALARKLGVAGRVRFAGYQGSLAPFYQHADLFVFPSFQEGLPVALMEAMAAGMACVVSDIRGNRELIDEHGGIRFPCRRLGRRQEPELAEAVKQLLFDHARRQGCGRYNRQKIKAFSLDEARGRMEQIYHSFDRHCSRNAALRQGQVRE